MQAGGTRSFGSLTVLALVVVLLPAVSRAETVYRYTSATFNNVAGVYTTSDRLTGEFTTASPLPANLSFQDISGLVTSFSFADGHQTMSEADLGSFDVIDFRVSTDASGAIADWTITLVLGVRVIQAISNAGSHNDSGGLDLSNYGGIAGVRGTWILWNPRTYVYTSSTFNSVAGVYTTSDRLTGEVKTYQPLPANLSFQDISGLVASFSFMDGHQTMSEADLGSFDVIDFRVSTDASGAIADWTITLVLGVRVIQAISNAGSHNDSGGLDLSNYGAITGVRGTWQIRAPAIPALGPPWLWALAVLLMTASGLALGSRARPS